MSNRLEGKIALIMGAGSVGPGWGNGRAIATRFAEEGAKIYGVDRELERMTETIANVKATHSEIETSFCDVTKTDSILEAVNACIKRFGRIDILVNNVGGSAAGGPVEMSEEVWDSQVDSNLKSVFLTCKHVLPLMEAQGSGGIINIASTSGMPARSMTLPTCVVLSVILSSRESKRESFTGASSQSSSRIVTDRARSPE